MKYFKFYWNENRGDKYSNWGSITFYHEVGEDFFATKQMEIYDNGNVLKYDYEHFSDEYGFLTDQALEIGLESTEISQEEFEEAWNSHAAINK